MSVNNKDLSSLIKKIRPLYNECNSNKKELQAFKRIEMMWEIGKILDLFIKKKEIAPHNLYRLIYGKSEGSENIARKSYITREFQGRCFRIYNMFKIKSEIKDQLFKLKSFTSFRECMPFFDNQKYLLKGNEKIDLLNLLNSNLKSSEVLIRIRKLQKQRIGIKNKRDQRLNDLQNEKKIFIDFYNYVYTLIKSNDFKSVSEQINSEYYLLLSKNTSSFCKDGLKYYDFNVPENINNLDKQYGEVTEFLITRTTQKEIRRFRKLIPVERISRLAEMIYALTDEKAYRNFR